MNTTANYLPVSFRLYHNFTYGENKGKPNPSTFFTVVLQRFVGCSMSDPRYETVGDTIGRLKDMLAESGGRYQILAAKETDEERDMRYKKDGLTVVEEKRLEAVDKATETRSTYDPINGDESEASPTMAADAGGIDDFPIITPMSMSTKLRNSDVEQERDNGRVKAKRAPKAAKEARAA